MNVLEAVRNRREITSFTKKIIPFETLEKVLDAGYMAPSGNNLPSKELILVTKREVLDHLSNSTPFVPWLNEATAAVVITGRPNISKYWLQDASIASGFIWLSAVELGLGAAFGAIYHAEDTVESEKREVYVRKALSIPDDRRIVAILGLGYAAAQPKQKKLPPREDIVYYEGFKKQFE
jgi:nitroreductase